jgi:hypothetical protein
MLFPDAVQREALLRRCGIVPNAGVWDGPDELNPPRQPLTPVIEQNFGLSPAGLWAILVADRGAA